MDTSLFEAGIIQTYWHSAMCFATGRAPGPMGTAHPLNAPYQAFPTSDGWITVGAANQGNWLRLVEALEAPGMRDDPRFATNADRMRNLEVLAETLTPLFKRRSSAEWLRRLEEAGVPAGPVLEVGEMHRDPQALAREMIVQTEHPTAGSVKAIGLPIKFSDLQAVCAAPLRYLVRTHEKSYVTTAFLMRRSSNLRSKERSRCRTQFRKAQHREPQYSDRGASLWS